MKTKMIGLVILGLISGLAAPSFAGGVSDGGGSGIESELKGLANEVVEQFQNLQGPDLVLGVSLTQLKQVIKNAKVDSTLEKLFIKIDGVQKRVDALNNSGLQKITVSLYAYPVLDKTLKQELALHEFLGLLEKEKNDYDLSRAILLKLKTLAGGSTATLSGMENHRETFLSGIIVCESKPVSPTFGNQIAEIDLKTGTIKRMKWNGNETSYQISTKDVLLEFSGADEGLAVNIVGVGSNPNLASSVMNFQLIASEASDPAAHPEASWKATMGYSEKTSTGYSNGSIRVLCAKKR